MSPERLAALLADLQETLARDRDALEQLNREATGDADVWIREDHDTCRAQLAAWLDVHRAELAAPRKPKGDVLVVLSYNEPFIVSVLPIVGALAAGNRVTVRPSSRGRAFFDRLWLASGLVRRHALPLAVEPPGARIEDAVARVRAVYLFGSHAVARKLARVCADAFVELHPEIEAADCKAVWLDDADPDALRRDAALTIDESFTHAGQTCQRIQGVYVRARDFERYAALVRDAFEPVRAGAGRARYLAACYRVDEGQLAALRADIDAARPAAVATGDAGLPALVVAPDPDSELVQRAYFLPALWIAPVASEDELVARLAARRYCLGLNLWTDRPALRDRVIRETRFTRHTINTAHTRVRPHEGWGGAHPSGLAGYQSWLAQFSYPYTVIT